MRYAWHMRTAYFGNGDSILKRVKARAIDAVLGRLRAWDRHTAQHVTHFLAISRTVQQRIAECYDRDSTVIYPPVDTDFYHSAQVPREDYYLVVSAFARTSTTWPWRRRHDWAGDSCDRHRAGRGTAALAGGAAGRVPGMAVRRGDPRPSATVQGAFVPRRGRLRHRAAGGARLRSPGHRPRPRRCNRNRRTAGQRTTDGPVVRGTNRGIPGRGDRAIRALRGRLQPDRSPQTGAPLRPAAVRG
jgi:hypothetical protein